MFFKLAIRNILRNRWRSVLTLGGIAVGVAMVVWTVGMYDAFNVTMIRGATAVDVGQIQIHSEEYVDKASVYHHFAVDQARLDEVRAVSGVAGAAPRVHLYGLIGNEERSQVARIVGVDPEQEQRVTRLVEGISVGKWLAVEPREGGPREVVLGKTFAQQLGVDIGAELVLFLQATDGSLGNEVLEVVGVVETGNTNVDRNTVFVHITDAQYVAALEGRAHEVTIAMADFEAIDRASAEVQAVLDKGAEQGPALVARPWHEVVPHLAQMIEVNEESIGIIYLIIYLIVGLGILNTQRMSALERRREFGVLLAVGVSPRQLGLMIVAETVFLTLAGAIIGGLMGYGMNAYHAAYGLDMAMFTDSASFSFQGISFDERMYFVTRLGQVVEPVLVLVGVSVFCGLWPAVASARLDAIRTIAGRT